MRIVISHNVLEHTANEVAIISEAFGKKIAVPVDVRTMAPPAVGVGMRAWHEGDDFIIEYDDQIMIKVLKIYTKVACFIAPIVKQCVAFAGEIQADLNEIKRSLKGD